jgi:alpha-1,6-mannosyltransferase
MAVQSPLGATPQGGAYSLPTLRGRAATRLRSKAGLLGLSGVLVCGLILSLGASGTDSLLPESTRPVPNWLAGPFGSTGLNLGVVGLIATLSVMFVSYTVSVRAADRLSARTVLMAIAALHALVLLAPPLLSTDVFSYQIYGRMGALYGANPYLHGPHAIALDPLYPFIGAKWVSTPTAYGPIFTGLSYILAPLSIAASALAYKAIAALASLAAIALLWNAARLRGVNPVRAVALFGLNPLIVVYGVGGGHNDLLMLALLLGGVLAALQYHERAGGGLIVVSAAIKLTSGLLLPFALARSYAQEKGSQRFDLLIGAAVAAAAIAVLGLVLFGSGPLRLPHTMQTIQNEGDWHSIPGFISTRLGLGTVGHATGLVLAALFVVVFVILIRRVMRGQLDWIEGAAWATAAMLATASALLPWYVAWLAPFVALSNDRRLWRTALVMTGVIQGIQMLGYIPHGSSLLGL